MKRWSSIAFLTLAVGFPRFGTAQSCTPPDVTITYDASSSDGYVCGGASVTAEVPDAGPGATYAWETGSTFALITSGQGTRTVTVSVKDALTSPGGALGVTVTNACGTNAGNREIRRITLSDVANASIAPSPTIIGIGPVGCANSDYTATISPGPAYVPPERIFQWQVNNGTIVSGQGTPSIAFHSGSGSVTWSVIRQDRCSPLGAYPTHSGSFLAADPISQSPTIVGPDSVAPDSTGNNANLSNWQELFLGNGPRVSNFMWSVSNGALPVPGDAYGVPLTFSAGSSGNVTITATLSDYCGHTYTPSLSIPIGQSPPAAIVLTADDRICSDEEAQASVTPVQGAAYGWTIAGGAITDGQGTPTIKFVPTGAAQVALDVMVNVTARSKLIDVSPRPDASIAAAAAVLPRTSATASAAHAGAGARYAWSAMNAKIVGPSDQREITYVAGDAGNVRLDLLVMNASGCGAVGSTTIAVVGTPRHRAAGH
jgi:PKD-like domain